MSRKVVQRIGLYILAFGIQSLYWPLTRNLEQGIIFDTRWDVYVPLWPIWIVPYSICVPLWMVSYGWAALRMEEKLYHSLISASVMASSTAMSIYALYPTYVVRPVLVGDDWATEWLRLVYARDGLFNAFPSGHVYLTTILALFWSLWYPRWRWAWMGFALVTALSTLFTGQHYIPDVIGGVALAWISYRAGLWFVGLNRADARSDTDWRLFPG